MKDAQTTQEALNAALRDAQAWKAAALAAQAECNKQKLLVSELLSLDDFSSSHTLKTERDALAAQVEVLQQAITDSTRYSAGSLPADFQWSPFLSRHTDCLSEIRAEAGEIGYYQVFKAGLVIDYPTPTGTQTSSAINYQKVAIEQSARVSAAKYAESIRQGGAA